MIATEDFVYVHIPKTGGTYVRNLFEAEIRFEDEHLPWSRVPEHLKNLPAFCTIRNPWAWYVSWYHFALQVRPSNDERWATLMDSGRATFEEFVRRAFDHPRADLYTRSVNMACGRGIAIGQVRPLHLEHLSDELPTFLAEHGITPAELHSEPQNVSSHRPYRDYYSAESRALVAGCPIAERYGYCF